MFSLTFLGTSASAPSPHRGLPSVAVRYDGSLFLFDCGEGTQRQMMKYKVGYGSLEAIFITHNHLDHFLGIYGLVETLALNSVSPRKLKIFVPKNFPVLNLANKDFVEINYIKEGKLYEDKNFSIFAFEVKHSNSSFGFILEENDKIKFYEEKAKALGIKGEFFTKIQEKGYLTINKKKIKLSLVTWKKKGRRLVYTGDTAFCSEVVKASREANLLIHESTFDSSKENEAKERNHTTAKEAAQTAKKAKVKQLVLTHISPRYADTSVLLKEAKEVFANTIIAEDGLTIEL